MNLKELESDRQDKEAQLSIIIERYNELELAFRAVERECNNRDVQASRFKEEMEAEMNSVKDMLEKIRGLIIRIEKERTSLAKEFRAIVKQDLQRRLEKRVDQLKYEEYISKDGLYRLLERYKKN